MPTNLCELHPLNPPLSARSRTHIVMAKRSEIHASLGLTTLITYGYKMCGIFAVHAMPRNAAALPLKLWDRDVSFCQVLRKCRHCVCRVLGGDFERSVCSCGECKWKNASWKLDFIKIWRGLRDKFSQFWIQKRRHQTCVLSRWVPRRQQKFLYCTCKCHTLSFWYILARNLKPALGEHFDFITDN